MFHFPQFIVCRLSVILFANNLIISKAMHFSILRELSKTQILITFLSGNAIKIPLFHFTLLMVMWTFCKCILLPDTHNGGWFWVTIRCLYVIPSLCKVQYCTQKLFRANTAWKKDNNWRSICDCRAYSFAVVSKEPFNRQIQNTLTHIV